jgi:hypothetical protein
MKRRTLLAAFPVAVRARAFERPIGLNLFTVRGPLAKDPAATYQSLARIGVQVLEVRPPNLTQHAAMIRDAGLKPVHMFIESAAITGAWDEWHAFQGAMASRYKTPAPRSDAPRPTLDGMIELAKTHGIQRIGTSMLLPGERANATTAVNAAAKKCATAGLELYYHNHAYSLPARAAPGTWTGCVRNSIRVSASSSTCSGPPSAAKDPTSFCANGRDACDRSISRISPPMLPAAFPSSMFRPPLSESSVKAPSTFPAILKAARQAGVEHYFIELDHTPGDPLDSVRRCVDYLKRIDIG